MTQKETDAADVTLDLLSWLTIAGSRESRRADLWVCSSYGLNLRTRRGR
jgi:hypothetical protein